MHINKEKPLVTVYMPTHNRVELLQRAAESVLNQDYQNIELIIVDDNSTDSTPEYLAELVKKDSRVSFFRNEVNSGACVSRNKAIFSAKGEFITGLDDDDYFLPHHISSFLDKWNSKLAETIALYANILRKTSGGIKPTHSKIKKCKAKDLIYANWPGNQIFTKTSLLVRSGGFDPEFPAWQDLECWYNLLKLTSGTAERTKVYSYVLDISHPHERISDKKFELMEKSYINFCNKHMLSVSEREISKLMLTHYGNSAPSFRSVFKKLHGFLNWHNIRHVFIIYFVFFSNKLKK